MSRKTTMQDVAQAVGVSRTTVSLVLNGEGLRYRIAEETQQRILDYVEKTGFRPNYFASALNRKQTGWIGIIFPDLFESFIVQVLRGIEDVFLDTEFMPLICTNRFDVHREARQIEQLIHRGVDGLIVAPTALFSGTRRPLKAFRDIEAKKLPMVFIDRYLPAFKAYSRVVQDDRAGGQLAADYLRGKGCRRFAYVGFDLAITSLPARLEGFRQRLAEEGVGLPESHTVLLREIRHDAEDISSAFSEWAARKTMPDGLFISSAGLSVRCLEILKGLGVKAGKDIHVVRIGPHSYDRLGPVFGIGQPHQEMGRIAAEMLLAKIQGEESPFRQVTLPFYMNKF